MISIRKRKKLIPLVVGLAVLIGLREYGVTIPGLDRIVQDILIAIVTLIGVERVRNDV